MLATFKGTITSEYRYRSILLLTNAFGGEPGPLPIIEQVRPLSPAKSASTQRSRSARDGRGYLSTFPTSRPTEGWSRLP
jgi:hypothetical protein